MKISLVEKISEESVSHNPKILKKVVEPGELHEVTNTGKDLN